MIYVFFKLFCGENPRFIGAYSDLGEALGGARRHTRERTVSWSEPDENGHLNLLGEGGETLTFGDGGLVTFAARAVKLDTEMGL